jgi:hypothetical protein
MTSARVRDALYHLPRRSRLAIERKARELRERMGIKPREAKLWSRAELEVLEEVRAAIPATRAVGGRDMHAALERLPGRSRKAIGNKLRELSSARSTTGLVTVSCADRTGVKPQDTELWSEAELEVLEGILPAMPATGALREMDVDAAFVQLPGRNRAAISNKLRVRRSGRRPGGAGCAQRGVWRDTELEGLRRRPASKLAGRGLTSWEVGDACMELPGRTVSSIQRQITVLRGSRGDAAAKATAGAACGVIDPRRGATGINR